MDPAITSISFRSSYPQVSFIISGDTRFPDKGDGHLCVYRFSIILQHLSNGTEYSRMDLVKFSKNSTWSILEYFVPNNFHSIFYRNFITRKGSLVLVFATITTEYGG